MPLPSRIVAFLMLTLLSTAPANAAPPDAVDFARDVRPLLSKHCLQCHGPDAQARKGDLRLDDREPALLELPTGNRAIVPEHPADSELIDRITSDDDSRLMPPPKFAGRLTSAEVETLRRWIAQGAHYSKHWAYVKPVRVMPPVVSNPAWPANEIDQFILYRLDEEGITPSPVADRETLLRRVTLDLTGLPPTLEELRRFNADTSPDAYERVVDALLGKAAYGERWGAVWLDLARYGDSQGYIHDPPRTIWRWRDWLITALNNNLPYDQFTLEMLAGDLLPGATTDQRIATGFHRNTTNNTEGGSNVEEYRHASVVDRVNTTMQVWQGTTFGCAQCHSHKYDPFSQTEYYQVFAIFNATEDNNSEAPTLDVAHVGREEERVTRAARVAVAKARLDEQTKFTDSQSASWEQSVDRSKLAKEIVDILDLSADKRTKEQTDKLTAHHRTTSADLSARQAEFQSAQSELERVATTTLVMKEIPARPTHVAIRGEFQTKGDVVQPGVPAILNSVPSETKLDRLAFARWLVDPENPLTARVAVNRLWQELFGVGLVESAEEFGSQGSPPSHPELLDWLATEYIRLGWDTKQLLKKIVMSTTYRQSSRVTDELQTRDPQNRLLARGPRVRLPAETVRDQALAVAGLLSPKLYGPPVHPLQPKNGLSAAFGASTDWETSLGEDGHRRALYTRWRRNLPYASMITFDAPERSVCNLRRIRTNTPLQALVTMNDPVCVEAAQGLGRRILNEGGETVESRATHGFQLALSRSPSADELKRLVSLFELSRASLAREPAKAVALATKPLGPLPAQVDPVDAAAWTVVGNVLLNLDEFLAKR